MLSQFKLAVIRDRLNELSYEIDQQEFGGEEHTRLIHHFETMISRVLETQPREWILDNIRCPETM